MLQLADDPKEPCGQLVCESSCTKDQRLQCCDPRKKKSECKDCAINSLGAPVCVERPCDVQAACLSSPGCSFKKKQNTTCDSTCGVEVCEAYDACSSVSCGEGKECKVITNVLAKAISGSDEHEIAICVKRRSGSNEVNDCSTKMCPTGTTCTDAESGPPQCVPLETANCGGCDADESCVATRNRQSTEFTCQKPEDKPLCDVDECSCSGTPCEQDEQCHVLRNKTAICFAKHPQAPSDSTRPTDICSDVICPEGNKCYTSRGVVSCKPERVTPCKGVRCEQGKYCEDETGDCILPVCDPPCENGNKCVHTEGIDVCVADDRCKRNTWTWFEDTCIGNSVDECGEGRYCPPADTTNLAGCVSEFCGCDPLTGETSECSPTCHPVFRYCLPDVWSCDIAERDTWEPEQARWCCFAKKIGCVAYNCNPFGGEGPEMWAPEKKKWCCDRTKGRVGCEPDDNSAYNCYTDEEWSFEKHTWCCENKQLECPAPLHDCRDTRQTSNWSPEKAKWCCDNRDRGCPEEEAPKYNCTSKEKWSKVKRQYCCNEFGVSCENNKPTYDCEVTEGGVATWTVEQKAYCCKTVSVGCSEDTATEGPFDCEGSFDDGNEDRRKWCCVNDEEKRGCKSHKYCDEKIAFDTTFSQEDSDRCCSTQNLACKYQCPSDPLKLAKLAQTNPAALTYCCDKKGIGCPPEFIEEEIQKEKEEREKKLSEENKKSVEMVINFVANWDSATENPKEFVRTILRTVVAALISANPSSGAEVGMQSFRPLFEGDGGTLNESKNAAKTQEIRTPFSWETDPVTGLSCGKASDYQTRVNMNGNSNKDYRSIKVLQSSSTDGDAIQTSMTLTDSADSLTATTETLQRLINEASSGTGPLVDNNEGDTLPMVPYGGNSVDIGVATGEPTTPPTSGGDDDDDDLAPWVYVLIALGSLCVAGTAIAVFIKSKKGGESDAVDTTGAGSYSFAAVQRDTEMLETRYSTPSDSHFGASRGPPPGVTVGRI
eukprot:TRINITY_DN961_c0_g1_i10.p2 TRINITY_DN961_c0_g1~~TRINITY_DN961_c0_g1_i10.p2  ORF type:complete len:996 (+),score=253.24 TRINITY_DN961_c0_g1_i10:4132-7119(+)